MECVYIFLIFTSFFNFVIYAYFTKIKYILSELTIITSKISY